MEFVARYIKPTTYKDLLPPFQALDAEYHLDPETAFTAIRPILSLLFVRRSLSLSLSLLF